uniref:Uncharacterized protein n=1 Tax=viral metagenome TaxID=1070528 RepID=A0A6C0BT18_9ZZZZ
MELLIPIVAGAGLINMHRQEKKKESYVNVNNENNKVITNANTPKNYPVISNDELRDSTVQGYNSQQPRDKYYNNEISYDNQYNDINVKNVKQFTSLTGNTVSSKELKHNNMQPYFGAKIRGHTSDYSSNEPILDLMVGSGSQYVSKTEHAPLFQPQQNYNYPTGAPIQTDFVQSRVNPSMRHANSKPWEEVKVAPGLNQGYTTNSSNQGFNSALEARDSYKPRGVDELRAKNNPKQSYSLDGHKGPASYYIKEYANKANVGKVEKNRPDRFYDGMESMQSDKHALGWGFTTTGLEKGQTARSNIELKHENRSNTTTAYEGIASSHAKKAYIPGEYSDSRREDSKTTPLTSVNAIGRAPASEGDYGLNSITIEENNRTCNDDAGFFGAIKGAMGAVTAPFMDMLKPSRKEGYIGNIRQYGNMSMPVNATYNNNPNDKLKVTNREMDVCAENHLNVEGPRSGAYHLNTHNAYSDKVNNHIEYIGAGGGSGVSNGHTSYDSASRANINQSKEALMASRINHGNSNHVVRNVNYNTSKLDCDRVNTYLGPAGSALTTTPPSVNNMGYQDAPYQLRQDLAVQRIEPNILEAFKKNPYTQSLTSTY